jgi:hypothetical protein
MANWKQSTQARQYVRRFWPSRKPSRKPVAGHQIGGGMPLSAMGVTAPADLRLVTPTMRVAVIEDLCWAIARADWLARRPPRWRWTARRGWRAEQVALNDKRGRIADLVALARTE